MAQEKIKRTVAAIRAGVMALPVAVDTAATNAACDGGLDAAAV